MYLRFNLIDRDVEELMAERGIEAAHERALDAGW
jgi:transposase-like protein